VVTSGQGQVTIEHWDGQSWQEVALPPVTLPAGDSLQPDPYLVHDVNGRWSRVAVPAAKGYTTQLSMLSWIPGTRSVWAAGNTVQSINGLSRGIILKNGS
jgi:hypothetical protein